MSLENLLWFFLQPWTVGAMFSCIFGLHEFLPSRGVLGAAVVKIIEYFFLWIELFAAHLNVKSAVDAHFGASSNTDMLMACNIVLFL